MFFQIIFLGAIAPILKVKTIKANKNDFSQEYYLFDKVIYIFYYYKY